MELVSLSLDRALQVSTTCLVPITLLIPRPGSDANSKRHPRDQTWVSGATLLPLETQMDASRKGSVTQVETLLGVFTWSCRSRGLKLGYTPVIIQSRSYDPSLTAHEVNAMTPPTGPATHTHAHAMQHAWQHTAEVLGDTGTIAAIATLGAWCTQVRQADSRNSIAVLMSMVVHVHWRMTPIFRP